MIENRRKDDSWQKPAGAQSVPPNNSLAWPGGLTSLHWDLEQWRPASDALAAAAEVTPSPLVVQMYPNRGRDRAN
jgi:hypothetical protein